ncbi:hypothetical protein AQJ66_00790 [Streptomyces bungoensis]|uniref:Uncharacterized protein n=1 Tax=Streptomyces bungoensis TaxID=285568 RepID=A0A117RGY3_9ACTN|nr:hypothetical protein AQJ66_00790 [Streptomyces bungoensis]
MLLLVYRGPFLPPVVMDQECRLMLSRTPGRIRKLLRKVSAIDASFWGFTGCVLLNSLTPSARTDDSPCRTSARRAPACGARHRKTAPPGPAGHDQSAPMY